MARYRFSLSLLSLLVASFLFLSCGKGADDAESRLDNEADRQVPGAQGEAAVAIASRPQEHILIEGNSFSVRGVDGNVRRITPKAPETVSEDVAYALSMSIIRNIKGVYSEVFGRNEDAALSDDELGAFLQGLLDANGGHELSNEYMVEIGNALQSEVSAAQERKAAAAREYFRSLETRDGIFKTESGLMYEVISQADENAKRVGDGDKVNVDYVMSVFQEDAEGGMVEADSNEDIVFDLSGLIPGASEGIRLMAEGAEYVFYINPDLGYGPIAVSPVIGPDSYLIFRVRVNSVIHSEPDEDLENMGQEDDAADGQ